MVYFDNQQFEEQKEKNNEMLGFSYGEVFLLIGATAALIGPKDLPKIARTAGRLAGRAIGYVQMARGQFDNVMEQSQASQVHKELQDAMAQLEAIRYEIRSISVMNPRPITRQLMDEKEPTTTADGTFSTEAIHRADEKIQTTTVSRETSSSNTSPSFLHSQALAYERLAEAPTVKYALSSVKGDKENIENDSGLLSILPISAESAGILPNRRDDVKGSDILLEAIIEADVADKAKSFFAQPENQIKSE